MTLFPIHIFIFHLDFISHSYIYFPLIVYLFFIWILFSTHIFIFHLISHSYIYFPFGFYFPLLYLFSTIHLFIFHMDFIFHSYIYFQFDLIFHSYSFFIHILFSTHIRREL